MKKIKFVCPVCKADVGMQCIGSRGKQRVKLHYERGKTRPRLIPWKPHETRPVQVWIDADLGIADMVVYLNTIPGVRTDASCQGTIGEGGAEPYRAYVMCAWTPEALVRLNKEFDVVPEGNNTWGYVHPRIPTRFDEWDAVLPRSQITRDRLSNVKTIT